MSRSYIFRHSDKLRERRRDSIAESVFPVDYVSTFRAFALAENEKRWTDDVLI
jgi:hypothetical protein